MIYEYRGYYVGIYHFGNSKFIILLHGIEVLNTILKSICSETHKIYRNCLTIIIHHLKM